MSTRTFILTNTLVDAGGNPIVGRSITATLLVPGGVPAVDTDGKTVVPDQVSAPTDSSGAYSLTLIYPGDVSPAGCVYSIDEAGATVLSPSSFAYASTITTSAWYAAGGPAGTVKCRLDVVLANDSPVSGRYVHITPQQNTEAPDGTLLSVFSSVDVLLDGTGRATFWLWPSGSLSPTTYYTCRIDGEATRLSFSVPTSTSDPLGENILLHVTPFGAAMAVPVSPGAIGPSSSLVVQSGDPVQTPSTLGDDIADLQYRTGPAVGAAARLYASDSFH